MGNLVQVRGAKENEWNEGTWKLGDLQEHKYWDTNVWKDGKVKHEKHKDIEDVHKIIKASFDPYTGSFKPEAQVIQERISEQLKNVSVGHPGEYNAHVPEDLIDNTDRFLVPHKKADVQLEEDSFVN
jgi:hypothetical protein